MSKSHWQQEVTALAGGASTVILFPRRIEGVSVRAVPGGGGTANVQFTLDKGDDVIANPGAARWEFWEPGSVSVSTTRALAGPVTGIRLQAVTADALLQAVGDFDY